MQSPIPTITRQELHNYLGRMAWTVAPNVIAEQAERNGAPQSIVQMINGLPVRVYMSEGDLWDEIQAEMKRRSKS